MKVRYLFAAIAAAGLAAENAEAAPKLKIEGYEQGGAERLTVQLDERTPLTVYRIVLNRKFNANYCDTAVAGDVAWVTTPAGFWNRPLHLNYGDYFEVGTGASDQCVRIVSLLLQTNQGWVETKW